MRYLKLHKFAMTGVFSALTAVALTLSLATMPLPANAKKSSEDNPKAAKKSHKAKRASSGGKVTFNSGSEETTGARNARLKRECKGRANSGMCSGFGQGS